MHIYKGMIGYCLNYIGCTHLHTYKGEIGYCLNDIGCTHFESALDAKVKVGNTLHSIYGKANLKTRVNLTDKNVVKSMYMCNKYTYDRPFVATSLITLIEPGIIMPSANRIIPLNGLGMKFLGMLSL